MSDPLSIAASVTAVAGASFAVAKGLYQVANAIGSAGEEVRIYGDEVASFAKLLCHIRSELAESCAFSQETQDLLKDTVHLCERILHPIQSMLSTLQPLLARFKKSEGKLRQFGLRLQWIFRTKAKLLFYRSALNAQQKLLQTIMDVMILQVARRRPGQTNQVFCDALDHSKAAAKNLIYGSRCLHLDQVEDNEKKLLQASTTTGNDTRLIEKSMMDEVHPPKTTSPENETRRSLMIVNTNNSNFSDALTLLSPSTKSDTDTDEADILESAGLAVQIDQALDPDHQRTITAILADMSIISPRILEYAEREMRSAQDESGYVEPIEQETSVHNRMPLQNYRPARYQRIHVLCLHWLSDDLFVLPELEDLEKCFRENYGYTTEIFPIPGEQPQMALTLKMLTTLQSFQSSDSLLIIYYGGHAKIDDSRQSIWCATRHSTSPQLQWSAIQALFAEALPDVLIFLDCSAAAASAQFPRGSNVIETVAASAWDAITADPGRYSFTNALIEVLAEWQDRHFSASMLHAEILARLKHPRPIMINGKHFEARAAPIHFAMTSNFRTPSVEISALRSGTDAVSQSEAGPAATVQAPYFLSIRSRSGFMGK